MRAMLSALLVLSLAGPAAAQTTPAQTTPESATPRLSLEDATRRLDEMTKEIERGTEALRGLQRLTEAAERDVGQLFEKLKEAVEWSSETGPIIQGLRQAMRNSLSIANDARARGQPDLARAADAKVAAAQSLIDDHERRYRSMVDNLNLLESRRSRIDLIRRLELVDREMAELQSMVNISKNIEEMLKEMVVATGRPGGS